MNREFSFYEFVGVLVPSVIFLFCLNLILAHAYRYQFVNFESVGDSVVFIIISYGIGHVMHSLGNVFETILWWAFGGRPTKWLTSQQRLSGKLFPADENDRILAKVVAQFGERSDSDYGRTVYTWLFTKSLTGRIDIFNANYSLFRSLAVSFLLLFALVASVISWALSLIPLVLALLSAARMIRFARYYATEVYRTYLVTTV